MDENKLIKYDDKQLQKVGNAIAVTSKLLALQQKQFEFTSTNLQSWWNGLDENWQDIFESAIRIKNEPSIEQLEEILKVEAISIWYHEINTLEPLRIFYHLRTVELSNCPSIKNIYPLSNNKKLKKLVLSGTNIENIDIVEHFTHLEELWLPDKVHDLEPVSKLLSIKNLMFRKCDKISTLEKISNLIHIEELSISDSISDLSPIDSFQKIKRLLCLGVPEAEVSRYQKTHSFTEIIHGEAERDRIDNLAAKLHKAADEMGSDLLTSF